MQAIQSGESLDGLSDLPAEDEADLVEEPQVRRVLLGLCWRSLACRFAAQCNAVAYACLARYKHGVGKVPSGACVGLQMLQACGGGGGVGGGRGGGHGGKMLLATAPNCTQAKLQSALAAHSLVAWGLVLVGLAWAARCLSAATACRLTKGALAAPNRLLCYAVGCCAVLCRTTARAITATSTVTVSAALPTEAKGRGWGCACIEPGVQRP